jgi:hypothetical protein
MIRPLAGCALEQNAESAKDLAACYGQYEGLRSNHVVTESGLFQDQLGSSRGLSSESDRELLIELRRHCDLVLVDAATARRERYRSIKNATLGIISASGNFDGIPAIETGSSRVVLFSGTTQLAIKEGRVWVVPINPERVFHQILSFASSESLPRLLLEAGPTLTKMAFRQKLVSQSAITTLHHTDSLPINPFAQDSTLVSLAREGDHSFSFWLN